MPRLTMDAIMRRNREIVESTMTDLGAGALICSQAFPASSEQVAQARTFVKDHLKDHPDREIVSLLTSEVTTNAVQHSGTRFFGLTITRLASEGLRVVVTDEGWTGTPHLGHRGTDAESGRGMRIIERMAARWGVVRRPGIGTAVWFESAPH